MSAEGAAIGVISLGIRDYSFNHNGQIPTNWGQISEFRDVQQLNRGTFPILDHYVFLTQDKIPLLNTERGEVFLIRVDPVTNTVSGEEGRYIISLAGGSPLVNWLAETNVQKMLAAVGITELPQPEPWPPATNSASQPLMPKAASNSPSILEPPPAHAQPTIEPEQTQPQTQVEPSTAPTADFQTTPEAPQPAQSSKWPLILVLVLVGGTLVFLLRRKRG